jgi:superfamily II DNA or RNA helicase
MQSGPTQVEPPAEAVVGARAFEPETIPPVPVLELRIETLLVQCDDGFTPSFSEVQMPVLELGFRYGASCIHACDPRDRLLVSSEAGLQSVPRDRMLEERARHLLESFGAVELECLDRYEPPMGSSANYVVHVAGDEHDYCSFGAYALPQLRAQGWSIAVVGDYPYAVLSGETPWYAMAEPNEEQPDWFSFELGIVVGGKRISMLPALVDLLDRSPDEGTLDALLGRPKRYFALPTPDGRYLPVEATRMRRVVEVLRELYDGPLGGVRPELRLELPLSRALALDGLVEEEGACPIQWTGSARVRERARAHASATELSCEPPHGLLATLRGYQRQGVAWLQQLRSLGVGGILADDMGLGKTLQTIAHILIEKERGRLTTPCLVVAPTSLVTCWQREINKFAPSLKTMVFHGAKRRRSLDKIGRVDVVITTYALLWRDEEIFAQHRFHLLVADEAQTIKNRRSQAHRAVVAIDAEHKLCLTGTPLENSLSELHALFDMLCPGLLGHPEAFKQRFSRPIESGNEERLEQLRRRVAPFMLRRVKEMVAPELPPKTELVRPVDLKSGQRELYESIRVAAHAEVRKLIRKKGLAASTLPVLDALMKLRQVCCDPRLVRVDAARGVTGSAKLDVLLEMVTAAVAEGRHILVFSQFTSMLALISERLLAAGIRHVKLTGQSKNRQRLVDDFQAGRADVFLISLKAGGTGLTLTRADTVIHFDPWWNPAAQAQATDRAYRIGQTRPVFVYNLIAAGSVEERILQLQRRKRKLADAILSGGGVAKGLDLDDVDDLFAPLEG